MSHLKIVLRYVQLVVALFIMAFGISLITRAGLGTEQISSIPYVLSLIFPPTFGMFTIAINILFVFIQFALLRKRFPPLQFLQIIAGICFGSFIDFGMFVFSFVQPTAYWMRIIVLLIGCCVLAIGIFFEVDANVIMNPGEGLVRALSIKTGRKFGTMKVINDCVLIVTAAIISLIAFGTLRGVREGTVIAALIVGNIVKFLQYVAERVRGRNTRSAKIPQGIS